MVSTSWARATEIAAATGDEIGPRAIDLTLRVVKA